VLHKLALCVANKHHAGKEDQSMANGDMGKKTSPELKKRGLELIKKGNTIQQVAKRLGVSESLVRNWVREANT
jgi:transposase-like protein